MTIMATIEQIRSLLDDRGLTAEYTKEMKESIAALTRDVAEDRAKVQALTTTVNKQGEQIDRDRKFSRLQKMQDYEDNDATNFLTTSASSRRLVAKLEAGVTVNQFLDYLREKRVFSTDFQPTVNSTRAPFHVVECLSSSQAASAASHAKDFQGRFKDCWFKREYPMKSALKRKRAGKFVKSLSSMGSISSAEGEGVGPYFCSLKSGYVIINGHVGFHTHLIPEREEFWPHIHAIFSDFPHFAASKENIGFVSFRQINQEFALRVFDLYERAFMGDEVPELCEV